MKAITVRQPWAWAIATGAKTVENRTRGTAYRGSLAIHAGKGWSQRGALDTRILQLAYAHAHAARDRDDPTLLCLPATYVLSRFHRFGEVLAVAQLVDSHPDTGCCRPWGESSYAEAGGRTRTVIHHLVLDDIHALPAPLPARGALGLWTPDPDLIDALGVAA